MTRRVVITGVGAVSPLGNGATTLHERWKAGECGIESGVGACNRSFVNLYCIDNEIFAKNRKVRAGTNRGEIGDRASEMFFLCQDGNRASATVLIITSNIGW